MLRILRVKFAMGLMNPKTNVISVAAAQKIRLGRAPAVARQAVRESLVVLKNDARVLPIARGARQIHVAGKNMDDLASPVP